MLKLISVCWFLFALQAIPLLCVFLLHLLCLLLVPLLYLLLSGLICILSSQLPVVLFLLLLESLVLLLLFRIELILLLLVFPVQFRISSIRRSGTWMRWNVPRVDRRARNIVSRTRNRCIAATFRLGPIGPACFSCWYGGMVAECSRSGRCCDWWPAMVH